MNTSTRSKEMFSGEDAFKLNDTYGFPLDLTKDILEEKGITVDEDKFNALLAAQKATARAARKDAGADAWKGNSVKIDADKTEFVGYTDFDCDAKILAIVNNDGELVDMLGAGESGTVVLDKTPFYAQSGGQVGDSGVIKTVMTMHLSLPILLKMQMQFIFIRVRFHAELSAWATAYLQVLIAREESRLCATILPLIFFRLHFVRYLALMLSRQVNLLMKPKLDLTLLISTL